MTNVPSITGSVSNPPAAIVCKLKFAPSSTIDHCNSVFALNEMPGIALSGMRTKDAINAPITIAKIGAPMIGA